MRRLLLSIAITAHPVFAQVPGLPACDADQLLARATANSRHLSAVQSLGAR